MLIGLDLAAGNARTISRWYRLGKLVDVAECEVPDGKALTPVGVGALVSAPADARGAGGVRCLTCKGGNLGLIEHGKTKQGT